MLVLPFSLHCLRPHWCGTVAAAPVVYWAHVCTNPPTFGSMQVSIGLDRELVELRVTRGWLAFFVFFLGGPGGNAGPVVAL